MKTAEEWIHNKVPFREDWIELTKQIQLDAWKQGMSDAASKVSDFSSPFHELFVNHKISIINKAIKDERDKRIDI